MNAGSEHSQCPLCGGRKEPGSTTYTVDLGTGLIVVRDVPALVCSQCGEEWIAPDVAVRPEDVVNRARADSAQIEVVTLSPAAVAA